MTFLAQPEPDQRFKLSSIVLILHCREASGMSSDNRGFGTMKSVMSSCSTETTLKWFIWGVRFRVVWFLWPLMVMLMFRYSGPVVKHGHDLQDSSSSSEQLLPPPLWTRPSQSYFHEVGLAADLTLQPGQQEQDGSRVPNPIYDGNLWRRRMLKGYGTPSSPSDMNHGSSKA